MNETIDLTPEAESAPSPVVSLSEIWATEYAKEQFLIGPCLLPVAGAMALSAETGVGKSWISEHIALCMVQGKPLFDYLHARKDAKFGTAVFPVKQADKVLYVDYELSHGVRKQRLPSPGEVEPELAERLVFARFPSYYRLDDLSFGGLRNLVKLTKPNVVIIDPLSSAHSYAENTSEIKRAFKNLDTLRQEFGVAVIVVHHASSKKLRDKDGEIVERNPLEMFRGHTTIVDWCDVAMVLTDIETPVKPEDHVYLKLAFAKIRHASKNRPPIALDIDCLKHTVRHISGDV